MEWVPQFNPDGSVAWLEIRAQNQAEQLVLDRASQLRLTVIGQYKGEQEFAWSPPRRFPG